MPNLIAQAAGLFTAPLLAGIGAAAVSIPIIIHLMSRFRRKPEAWGAMRFLIEAYQKQRKRLQVEKWLLLLVRCMVVLLAGFALAGPVLSGCASDGLSLAGGGGRVVYIVIDDALSSQTREVGTTRLEALKQQAIGVIDEMGVKDRAVVVRMARPIQVVLDEPTSDTDALRKAVEAVEARYSRGALIEALMQVDASIREEGLRGGDAVVVLLSDFPASSDYFEQPLPPELEGLGERASIVTALPPAGTDNLQVMSLTPRRKMVVAESTGSTVVGGEVRLKRFGEISQPRRADLLMRVQTSEGEVLSRSERAVRWPAGEREQSVNFDLPVQLPSGDVSRTARELVVHAQLVGSTDGVNVDVLPADDEAIAVVRLRDRLQIALIDDSQGIETEPGAFEPGQWVRAALMPRGAGTGGTFELSAMLPTTIGDEVLEPFDAVLILRPDKLTTRGWESLQRFTQGGGLVWVFESAAPDSTSQWAQAMVRTFDLPWTMANRMQVRFDEQGESVPLPLDTTTAPPEQLQFLAADWREKLGWVTVDKRLPMQTPVEDRWIVIDNSALKADERDLSVLMANRRVGQGSLVFLATGLDTRLTNLPVRALFVPLMHDTLRGVLGNTRGESAVVAGDRPALGWQWRGAGELTQVAGEGAEPASLFVSSNTDRVGLRDAAEVPGVYRGTVAGRPRLMAVNADPLAGDTVGGQRSLEQLLDELGGWAYFNDRQEEGGVLSQTVAGMDLTRPLLWALLALVLLETGLARWFSHATQRETPTIIRRVIDALTGDSSPSATKPGGDG